MQPEEHLFGGFDVGEEPGGMLHGHVDIPKMALERMLPINRICPRGSGMSPLRCCGENVRRPGPELMCMLTGIARA